MKQLKSNSTSEPSQFPSKHWELFFNKFVEIDTLPIHDWQMTHVIAYFCRKYQEHYQIAYTFKFNSTAPSKSFEVFKFKALAQMLSSRPEILKEYIDWFFETQVVFRKKRFTSVSFLCDANIVNPFKFKRLAMDKLAIIERSTKLPENYLTVINFCGFDYTTYGQLAFHKKVVNDGYGTEKDNQLLQAIQNRLLDLDILDKVK